MLWAGVLVQMGWVRVWEGRVGDGLFVFEMCMWLNLIEDGDRIYG